MSDWDYFKKQTCQEVGQRVLTGVVKNPTATIATGITAVKTAGAVVIAAAPYVTAIAIGAGIGYGAVKICQKLFSE